MPGSDLRPGFHDEIERIRSEIARMSAGVTELVPRATEVLLTADLEGAEYVLRGDDAYDARTVELEEACFRLLALQAPVASDLREIVSATKILADIERSADLCVNICKAARRIYRQDLSAQLRGSISRCSEQAALLFKEATEAYVNRDGARAAALRDMDDHLDSLHAEMIQTIFQTHKAEQLDLQVAVQLAVVARFYERIGDHAVNIADRIRYIVDGWVPAMRHGESHNELADLTD